MRSLRTLCYFAIATIALVASSPARSATPVDRSKANIKSQALDVPYTLVRDHTSSKVVFSITNYGMFGAFQDIYPMDPGEFHPGCEYPKGSNILHCYQGALWVGAIVGSDTLVSVGADGWQRTNEMYPDDWRSGAIVRQSNLASDPDYSTAAIADEEYIAVYYDTLVDVALTGFDQFENRPHVPLGLKIRQHSYSFGGPPDDDFILLRYTMTNVGNHYLNNVYIAAYLDADVWHPTIRDGFADDFVGSRWVLTDDGNDSLFVGYAADNDGDPSSEGAWNQQSARSVFAATLLDPPGSQNNGFNWWLSNANSCLDWGPRLKIHDRPFGTDASGTPEGDRNKYYVLSNPEIDFNQLWSGTSAILEEWTARPPCIGNPYMADTRFLLSFGGSDLAPGDSVQFGLAIVMGENLHTNPEDWGLFSSSSPEAFYNTLDFSDLETNVTDAQQLYQHLFYGIAGDADNSMQVTLSDVIYLINYLYRHGPSPTHANSCDVNGNCRINIADIVQLVRYLFESDVKLVRGCVE